MNASHIIQQSEKEKLGPVRNVMVFGVPVVIIIEILIVSKIFG